MSLPPPPPPILPAWATQHTMPTSPTMSQSTRLDAFMSVDDPYETFGTHTLIAKSYMSCGICTGILRDPCTCQANCSFVACLQCLQLCQPRRCPQCKEPLPKRLVPAKHYQKILDDECKSQGGITHSLALGAPSQG